MNLKKILRGSLTRLITIRGDICFASHKCMTDVDRMTIFQSTISRCYLQLLDNLLAASVQSVHLRNFECHAKIEI